MLTIWVTSWNRPRRLKDTLDSIAQWADLPHNVYVVDNQSSSETANVITTHTAVTRYWLQETNRGINWPIQNLLPTVLQHPFVMIADHDLHFSRPFSVYVDLLTSRPEVAVAKGLDSPEHPTDGELIHNGETWLLKSTERGGGVVMGSGFLRSMFPLPASNVDFDWHTCKAVKAVGKRFAVLPKACIHTGWRLGESTWQNFDIPERYVLNDEGEIVTLSGESETLRTVKRNNEGVIRTL